MIILYDKDTVEFGTTLGLGVLKDAITCEPSEEINGTYEVEMTYPIEGLHAKDLVIDNIIYTNVNPFEPDNRQAFRIYSVSKPINGILTINAQHISYDATKLIIYPATEGLTNKENVELSDKVITDTMKAVIANEDIKKRYEITVKLPETFKKTADITYTSPVSLRYFLANQIISGYEVELEFNNYKTTIVEKRGEDRGVVLNYGKNIEDIEETKSTNTTCSAIYPYYWKSSSTTSSGVNYAYQTLKIESSMIERSYDWLYSETSSSGVVGKIKTLITSTIKSYIFKEETTSNLYLWDTYSYVNVSDIDDWEMASDSTTTSAISNQVFNVLNNIVPITNLITAFSKSKEKMKAVLSVFQLYYNAYSGAQNYTISKSSNNVYTFTLNGFDQNLTNITIHGDSSYGTKTVGNVEMDNACYVEIGDTRLYCGYQVNSNLYYNNFLYVGPNSDTMESAIAFFNNASGSTEWNKAHTFISNKYMVLIYNAKESTYSNTIFIPRVKDTIEEDYAGRQYTAWQATDLGHHIYYTTEDGAKKYKYYNGSNLLDLSSDSLVCSEDKWTKIMTVKGLDPAYPSTSGETTTKIEKAVLNELGTYYANNAYTNSANIVQYQESFWLYSESKWQSNDSTILSADDTRLFVINGKADPYYTFRGGNHTKYSTKQEELPAQGILTVKKLPTSEADIDTSKLYIKETSGASNEYYIRENSKWVKLTLTSVPTNSVYVYGESDKSYYKSDFSSITRTNTTLVDPDNLPDNPTQEQQATLYIISMTNPNLDPYKGCIFLDKSYINNSNILIQPVDLTSLIDEKNDELFTGIDLESTVPANMQKTGKLLLDFIKEYYITKEENNPNKLTNETTISYMKIEGDNPLLDYVSLNKVLIGDTVHIRYGKLNISSDLRVKAVTYDAINNRYSEITLGEITETLASSVVTSSDGVSVLANDSGYTNTQDVNKIIAKNVIADKVSTQTFEATQAIVTSLDVEQLNANTAKIDSIITDPLEGNATSAMQLSGTIVTSIENASISEKKINYHTNLSYNWDDENRVLTITLGN